MGAYDSEADQDASGEGFTDHRSRLRAKHFRFDQEPEPDPEEGRWSNLRCRRFLKAWLAVNEPGGRP